MSTPQIRQVIARLADGHTLTEDEIRGVLDAMTDGAASPVQMGALLMALRVRGETVEEITGAAQGLRARMLRISAPHGAIDIVGTGGDRHGTYNVSTCASLVAAGAGVPVAKHGNRSVSSLSGASDVLAALGVKLDTPPQTAERAVREAGVCFLWAPMHHPAMKAWAPVRAELGIRTLFNLLGPMCNPAGVGAQVLGVFDRRWLEPLAHVMRNLGSQRVWVVHGADGLDELTTTGPTHVAQLDDGDITVFEVVPEDAGLPRASLADLKGGDAATNARAIRDVLAGKPGPFRDIVVLNAAAAMIVAGRAASLADGVEQAARSIDEGRAAAALDRLVAITNSDGAPAG